MSTVSEADTLSSALFGKTRRAVLALLYAHADRAFYLRQVARQTNAGLGAVQRELKRLTRAGVIERRVEGHQVFYQANQSCPIFVELQSLVYKTAGAAEVLRQALSPVAARVPLAFLYGSMATGSTTSASDVDVLVVGEVTFAEIVAVLGKAQEHLGRDVNPTVYPPAEFARKLAEKHHFLTTITEGPKVFLLGDEYELGRLAKSRVASHSPNQPSRNRRPARPGRP
jgi:predicted nucleotidyltransferase